MRISLLLATLVVGCGGEFGSPSEREPEDSGSWLSTSPRAIACRDLASAGCAQVQTCAPFVAKTGPGIGSACETHLFDECFRTAGLGGSNRTPAFVTSCASTVRASTCDTFLARYPTTCDAPKGSLVDGTSCAFSEQCESGFCGASVDSACGACMRPPAIAEACVGGACGGNLLCNSANQCAKPAVLAETCGPSAPCASSFFCESNKCVVRKKLGESCAGFGQCDSLAGTICGEGFKCESVKIARLGEACSLTANALVLCEAPARCIDDRCVKPKPAGQSCASSYECEGSPGVTAKCVQGRCALLAVESCQK